MTTETPAAPKRTRAAKPAAQTAAPKAAAAKAPATRKTAAKPATAKTATAKTATAKTATAKTGAAKPAAAKAAVARKPAARKPAARTAAVVPPAGLGEEVKAIVAEGSALASAAAAVVTKTLALKKRELVERVAALSGGKKKSVKDVVEATLAVLGEALEKGEELILPPFGKAKVNRSKDGAAGSKLLTVKLRRGEARAAKQPLAEDDE